MPELVGHGMWLEGGRHILLGVESDPVTYGLGQAAIKGDQQSLALLHRGKFRWKNHLA